MTRVLKRVATVLLLGILAGPLGAGVADAGERARADSGRRKVFAARPPARGLAAIELAGARHDGRVRPGHRFSPEDVRDVLILVTWNVPGTSHVQRLEFIAPDGSVYQTLTTPFESMKAVTSVETKLLVAGTWITEHSLFGRWRVHVYLDHAAIPDASEDFVIQPKRERERPDDDD